MDKAAYGSIIAQDVFQRKLNAIFLDIPGVTGIADDMVIYGKTDLEHDRHLINFLNICRKNTLMLNPDKMQFRLPQVSFFGHQWSAKGLSPDPKKIAVVRRMDLPRDVETMRSFLGLVNYLNRFSPHLAELSEPLREVCRQDTEFQLTKSVHVAFLKTKEEISKNVTLPYFNPRSDTTLQTNASKKGLGAVILQDSKPVMFALRALTGAEKNYQNLERECLAMIWGMEKFHYFLYGKHITLETDQKPLVSICRKHMVEILPRIQRLVVRSFPYQPFDVQYRRKVLEQIHEIHKIHTHYPQSNGFAEALVGVTKKLMEESVKEGKPSNFGLLQYRPTPISSTLPSPLEMLTGRIQVPSPLEMLTGRKPTPISSTLPSPLEMLTGRKPHSNLPQIPSSIGHNMDTSRIHKELLRRQPTATSTGATKLEPEQPVFLKEVHGNVWRTATVNQPAAEPDSYWVRFPDNSILRRTRAMIKPRSLPSHFELQAEAQQRNFEGDANSCFCDSFRQLNGQSMLPVMPMTSVTTPTTINRDSQVGEITDPITGATRPTSDRGAAPSPVTTPRCSTRSTKGVPPVRYTPSRK